MSQAVVIVFEDRREVSLRQTCCGDCRAVTTVLKRFYRLPLFRVLPDSKTCGK